MILDCFSCLHFSNLQPLCKKIIVVQLSYKFNYQVIIIAFRYEERIDKVEARITTRLRDQLGTAKNANEMFRIFSRFNALFVRPRIRGAIREYQKLLIGLVKDDIESLHDKFKVQYRHSKASKMSKVRDLPPLCGSIIWAKEVRF